MGCAYPIRVPGVDSSFRLRYPCGRSGLNSQPCPALDVSRHLECESSGWRLIAFFPCLQWKQINKYTNKQKCQHKSPYILGGSETHYRQHVCVPLPRYSCPILTPRALILGAEAFGRWLGQVDGACMGRNFVLRKDAPESIFVLSPVRGHGERVASSLRCTLARANQAGTLVSGLQALEE